VFFQFPFSTPETGSRFGGDRFGDGDEKLVDGGVVVTARQNLNAIERRVDRIEARPATFRL